MYSKICLILPCNLYVVPYFKIYDNLLFELKEKFDVLIWNRSLVKENCNGQILSYDKKDIANDKNPLKLFKYYGFYRFVKKQLLNNKYERIVFLDTSACTVVLLSSFLKKRYAGKYWIDIRDYSFEKNKIYKSMLKRALDYSFCCDVSSRGFFDFLPKINNYCVTHNIDYETIDKIAQFPHIKSEKIRISFIGNVRYYDLNVKLLERFKNDSRFLVQFFGTGSEKLQKYCELNNITNAKFVGMFPSEKTFELYRETDLINNIYGNESLEVKTALSNKLYYSAFLAMPILVSPNTYMSRLTTELGLGFDIDFSNEHISDNLYDWYMSFLPNNSKLESFKKTVINEQSDFLARMRAFLSLK